MGKADNGIRRLAHATPKTPTPALPEGERDPPRNKLLATSHPLITVTTYHAPRTTYPRADTWVRPYDEITRITNHNYRPHASFLDSPDEIRSPCRKRSRCSVVADAQMLERRGRFQTFPYRLRAEKLSMVFLQATGHEPLAISSPRTTYYAPRTRRADTRVRPCDGMNHKPHATGHMPLFRHSSRASFWLARAGPDRSSLRRSRVS